MIQDSSFTSLFTLKQIFNKRIFRIPDYQRGYSWKIEHIEALWDDINTIEEGGFHYTGMITTQKVSEREFVN
jgi:uncharacterized protein with ParB-like and HNH nuclease domain